MSSPNDPPDGRRSRGNKSVRFPEQHVSGERDGNSSAADPIEEDYFSIQTRSSTRRQSGQDTDSDASDNEDDEEREYRQTTRNNTFFNRQYTFEGEPFAAPWSRSGSSTPMLQVTPPPEAVLAGSSRPVPGSDQTRFPAGLQGGVIEGVLDISGRMTGMAPGAAETEDIDPLDTEYRSRREEVLRSLQPEQARLAGPRGVYSMPSSPFLKASNSDPSTPYEGTIDAIELDTLDSKLQQVLRDREASSHARRPSLDRKNSDMNSTLSVHENSQEKFDESMPRTSSEDPPDARQEARDLAQDLVEAHLRAAVIGNRSGQATPDGYVQNTGWLDNAATLDDDLVQDERPDDQEEQNQIERSERVDDLEVGVPDVPPPQRVREGVLGSLLRLYADSSDPNKSQSTLVGTATPMGSPGSPGALTPALTPSSSPPSSAQKKSKMPSLAKLQRPSYFRSHSSEDILGRRREEGKHRPKWYADANHKRHQSTTSLGALARSSVNVLNAPSHSGPSPSEKAAKAAAAEKKKRKKAKLAEQKRITIHIADVLQRQRFILRFGRALMLFGAPSHRLEEYLRMTSRVLEIDAQFLYLPGCMLVSFGDVTTHTSETKIIRVSQGLNLRKLDATHLIYKEVVHDLMGLEEASERIDDLLKSKNFYPPWMTIIFFGLASGFVAMFGYNGYWPDLPLTMFLGGLVGFLQIWVAPRSDLYSNVFEVTSSILASFLGRAFGSIKSGGKYVFCFSALTQASLALILPGYIILCGSLELQSKNLVAGAVRMFYAIVYSMFLAFGIALGAAIYGWIDSDATNESTCSHTLDDRWRILFVPLSALMLAMVNQAGPRQLPTMVFIASAGYTVLYFIQTKIENASSFTSALGAFTIGILGNLYSRIGHGLAFAAMLPGIFVLVPSGVAAQGSLVAGVALANEIVSNTTNKSRGDSGSAASTGTSSFLGSSGGVTDLGGTMVQVAVGITVGLFVATLVVYPLGMGKKRSGLFTF